MYTPCGTKKHLFDINSLQVKFLFFVQETHHRATEDTEFHRVSQRKEKSRVLSALSDSVVGFWVLVYPS
jgi:hypothetical protein